MTNSQHHSARQQTGQSTVDEYGSGRILVLHGAGPQSMTGFAPAPRSRWAPEKLHLTHPGFGLTAALRLAEQHRHTRQSLRCAHCKAT